MVQLTVFLGMGARVLRRWCGVVEVAVDGAATLAG